MRSTEEYLGQSCDLGNPPTMSLCPKSLAWPSPASSHSFPGSAAGAAALKYIYISVCKWRLCSTISYSASAAPFHGAYAAPFHTALMQHRFTHMALMRHHFIWRFCSTLSHGAYTPPLSLINFLRFHRVFRDL